jgi:PleD family two-component response regulator
LPIENIDKIKNINFDILLCDNPTELMKLVNQVKTTYIYTSFKMPKISGYTIAGEFKRYGYWFVKNTNNQTNI